MFLCLILRFFIGFIRLFRLNKTGKSVKSILIFASFFPGNAGYYYRSQKWAEELTKSGFKVDVMSSFNSEKFKRLTSSDSLIHFHFQNVFIRFIQVLKSMSYDRVIVRRSVLQYNDYGNLFLDKLLLSLHPNAILDFDDDLSNNLKADSNTSVFGKMLMEDRLIFYKALKRYKRFMPGSEYLKILLKNTNQTVDDSAILVLPTCVDYENDAIKSYSLDKKETTLGWIGSNGNQVQLDKLIPMLNSISNIRPIELLVISGKAYEPVNATFPIKNASWSLESEKEDLYKIDLGIMPLDNDKMSRAKCGFKLIQYMGLGIVSIASAITTNNRIIDDNENGFLVSKDEDWHEKLLNVIDMRIDFQKISEKARIKIREDYSFGSHIEKLIKFVG